MRDIIYTVSKLVLIVISLCATCAISIYALLDIADSTRTFTGEKTFDSIEEMQVFQAEIYREIQQINGEVLRFDTSMKSPIHASYSVRIKGRTYQPTYDTFKYGEKQITPKQFWIIVPALILFAFILLGITTPAMIITATIKE